jgi:hypothetical protein
MPDASTAPGADDRGDRAKGALRARETNGDAARAVATRRTFAASSREWGLRRALHWG